MTDEQTAFQRSLTPEKAAQILDQLEDAEEEHHHAGTGVPLRWSISFEVGEEDLPKVREELREVIDGGEES